MQNAWVKGKQSAGVKSGRFVTALLCGALAGVAAVAASAQVVPLAEVVSAKTILPAIAGNAGHIAANSFGDVFYVSQTDNVAYWLPRGRTTPIALVTGLSGGRSVTVSAANNVYVSSNYSGRVIEIPYANGTYATNTANSASLPTCTTAPSSPCLAFGNGAGATGYYLQASDLGFDQLGNKGLGPDAYVIDERDNVCNQSNAATTCNTILKFTPGSAGTFAASVVVTNLPQTNDGQIAVGPNGDVYYTDGTYVYYIAAGATTFTKIGTGLVAPTGVSTDIYGNLYITDSGAGANKIYEMPAVNGVAQPASQFIFLNAYSANGVAFDGLGHVFYTGYSSGTNMNVATLNSFNLGSSTLATPVSVTPTTLTVQFTGSATLGGITLQGASSGFSYVAGTCVTGTAYIAGSSCNFNVNYTPTAVGLQTGSVKLTTSTGATVAVTSLSGIGLGAAQTNDPGALTAIGSNLSTPQGIAVDGAGNVYIADPGQNAVLAYAGGTGAGTAVGTGLSKPSSVALGTAGNLYIADSGNGRVVEVPNVGGTLTSSAQTVIAKSFPWRDSTTSIVTTKNFGSTLGIATDLNNNLYVADASNDAVVRLGTLSGLPNAASTSVIGLVTALGLPKTGTSMFTAPVAVATDNTGNVFVADTTANTVTEITYYGNQTVNIGTGYSHPTGLAADAAGSLYIADSGNGRLLKVPYESPIFNTNDQYTVGSSIATPYGVALDSAANLYVVDSADAQAFELNRSQGVLDLGRANINTSTSQSNGYIGDSGNQTLNLGSPDYVATGNTTVFTLTLPSTGGCANSLAIPAGTACVIGATFSPTVIGSYSEKLAFNSNAANTATPSLTLTGTGLNQAPSTVSLAQTSPSGTAFFGQAVVITATISSTKAGAPSGTVTFYVDGAQQPHPSTVTNGVASISLNGLTGGKHTIGASYSGDNNFAPSAAPTITITVAQASSSTSLATSGGYQNPPSAAPGTALILVATVTPGAATVPTGIVTFSLGATTLGTASVAPISVTLDSGVVVTQYQANLAISTLPTGADSVVATYSGDVNYTSSSTSLLVTIAPPDFTLTPATTTLTVAAGATATTTFQVVSVSGFSGYVGMTCSGLPANTSCAFSPNGFVLQSSNQITQAIPNPKTTDNPDGLHPPKVPATFGTTTIVLSIISGQTPVIGQPPVGELHLPGFGGKAPMELALLALLPLGWFRRRAVRRLRSMESLLFAFIALAGTVSMFSGCGSQLVGNTPKGSYTVTINAASTAGSNPTSLAAGCIYTPSGATTPTCTQSATLTLVVQ